MPKRYQVTDGRMVLTLERDADDWFVVTSPIDPAMITQAKTVEEAFAQAKDAFAALAASRADANRWSTPRKPRAARSTAHRPVGIGT